jgi:hypothetical protein
MSGRPDVQQTETVLAWSHGRRVHLLAPEGILHPVDLAAIERLIHGIDDLDRVADVVAQVVGRPVRLRAWEPPTSDFFLEVEAPKG